MRLSRVQEKMKWRIKRRVIIFIALFYIVLFTLSLFLADYSFNEIVTGEPGQNIFELYSDRHKLNITILGKKTTIELENIADKLKSIYIK